MSFDLGVWYPSKNFTNKEAGQIYEKLCNGIVNDVMPNEAIDRFYVDLTSMHPEIDDVPEEDIDNTDLCPWSIAFDRSPGHLIICSVWSKADYVEDLILKLAEKHSLAVYNPQTSQYILPTIQGKPWWKLW